jgi:hypothetical protein
MAFCGVIARSAEEKTRTGRRFFKALRCGDHVAAGLTPAQHQLLLAIRATPIRAAEPRLLRH